MSHYGRIIMVHLQQEGITNMEQPVKSSGRNPIDYVCNKLRHVVNRIVIPW